METLQLEYFLSVADTLNISKSAKALYISQSSLSQSIKRLEKEIGYPLFDRNGKHISLNENGVIFLNCVNQIKKLYDNALAEIAEVNNVQQREISINMRCASYYLPHLMMYLRERLENTAFHITQQNYNRAQGEESDLVIIAKPQPMNSAYATLLLEEDILLAVPRKHRLYQSSDIVLSDLYAENFISLNPAWSLEKSIRTECEKQNFHPHIMIEVDNPDILRRLIAEQMGLAFVPEKTWGKTFASGEFDLRTVSDFSMKRYVYIMWKEGFLRENLKQCISYIQEFFSEYR